MASRMSSFRKPLHHWIPQPWRRWLRRMLRPRVFRGRYSSWSAAQRASRGYADTSITEKVIAAARAVRDGRALWDRDTVLFHEPAPNATLLRALRHVAAANGGRLNLIDFGGALGSTWRQNQPWLGDLAEIRWSIVEQDDLVAAGEREFASGPLRFYRSIAECRAAQHPTAILLSGVLAYLENPHALLRAIAEEPFQHLIIDRTGFVRRGPDRLTVQHVPPSIYEATYPAWLFNRRNLLAPFGAGWRIVEEWVNDEDVDVAAEFRGLLLERTC